MEQGVGTILHQARNRRDIGLPEVEAATRIRLRYLRAIENEEWDVLPGGVYTRGFIRTYAAFLGLDGERLAEDYRQHVEGWSRGPGEQGRQANGGPAPRPIRDGSLLPRPVGIALAIAAVLALGTVAVLAIPAGDDGGGGEATGGSAAKRAATPPVPGAAKPEPAESAGLSMRLAADAEVWVCVLDARGKVLVDGRILEAGAEEGPFHSGSFTVSFGNGEVSMLIDGREADIAETASPIGYAIDSSGSLDELSEAERPTCL
jgi:cytoskeleton protein RodZ